MDFSIELNFITGAMVGIEFVSDDEGGKYAVLDLVILRFVFGLHPAE